MMDRLTLPSRRWIVLDTVAVLLIATAIFLVRSDLVLGVQHDWARVEHVQTRPGGSMTGRQVVVAVGDRRRVVLVEDWMIRTEVGTRVCIARRALLLRRWERWHAVLPGYCAGTLRIADPAPGF